MKKLFRLDVTFFAILCLMVGMVVPVAAAPDNEQPVIIHEQASDHSYEPIVTAPTCTQNGYTTYTCVCGDTYVDDEVVATGHNYEGMVPPCAEQVTYTCTVCGDTYIDEFEFVPPNHDYVAVVTPPTCTTIGYTTYTCSICGDFYYDDDTETFGHQYDSVVTAPTCTAVGYITYTCIHCDDSYVADEVAAVGHSYVDGVCVGCGAEDPNGVDDEENPKTADLMPIFLMSVLTAFVAGLAVLTKVKTDQA